MQRTRDSTYMKNIYARKLISVIDTDFGIYPYKIMRRAKDKSWANFLWDPVSVDTPRLFESHSRHSFDSEKRLANLMEPRCQHRKVHRRNLNDGEAIERLPRDAKTSWQQLENGINAARTL